ncbi:MAG: ribosome-associated translation inhibitor RaiA [Cyanobacteria bacterium]|nr:ribosome-associated translation inhibitor RaiA [Cyanobacteriota bacterium]
MKLLIHGRNLDVTPALRDYTEEKLSRALNNFNGLVKEADVHLSVARNPRVPQQTAEVTVYANGTVIRAQERSENLYASIDLVAGKLSRQLRRHKERHSDHHHSPGHNASQTANTADVVVDAPVEGSLLEGRTAELPNRGVRRKYFAMPAMSLEDAMHQLDVIDHDFYVFRDSQDGSIQVVYRRNHGGYGVIQPRES